MQFELLDSGTWVVTTVTRYVPNKISLNFCSVKDWMEYTRRYITKGEYESNRGRFRCQCCRKPWDYYPETQYVNLVFMKSKHPNQVICEECTEHLVEAGVSVIKTSNEKEA